MQYTYNILLNRRLKIYILLLTNVTLINLIKNNKVTEVFWVSRLFPIFTLFLHFSPCIWTQETWPVSSSLLSSGFQICRPKGTPGGDKCVGQGEREEVGSVQLPPWLNPCSIAMVRQFPPCQVASSSQLFSSVTPQIVKYSIIISSRIIHCHLIFAHVQWCL